MFSIKEHNLVTLFLTLLLQKNPVNNFKFLPTQDLLAEVLSGPEWQNLILKQNKLQDSKVSLLRNLPNPGFNRQFDCTLVNSTTVSKRPSTRSHFNFIDKVSSYVLNRSTIKLKNRTKVSLTKVDQTSLINNNSFFSDMNSGFFKNLLNMYSSTDVLYKKSYNLGGNYYSISKLPSKSFKDLYLRGTGLVGTSQIKATSSRYFSNNLFYLNKSSILSGINKGIKSKLFKMTVGQVENELLTNEDFNHYYVRKRFREYSFKSKQKQLLTTTPLNNSVINKSININNFTSTKKNQIFLSKNVDKNLFSHQWSSLSLYHYLYFMTDPYFIKSELLGTDKLQLKTYKQIFYKKELLFSDKVGLKTRNLTHNNLNPTKDFNHMISKKAFDFFSSYKFYQNVIPWYHSTLVRFFEHISGLKTMIQLYPFVNQHVGYDWIIRYRSWLPRMAFYERMLGHKFFLEEALHIIHLAFYYKDAKLFSSWLKAIILRISFWKTRSIFRFLKYLMITHFYTMFKDLNIKGLKIKLKGKISVAGNSRKRSILYRVGKTSYSEVNLRVSHQKSTINTFTGVMGFQVWIFY